MMKFVVNSNLVWINKKKGVDQIVMATKIKQSKQQKIQESSFLIHHQWFLTRDTEELQEINFKIWIRVNPNVYPFFPISRPTRLTLKRCIEKS